MGYSEKNYCGELEIVAPVLALLFLRLLVPMEK